MKTAHTTEPPAHLAATTATAAARNVKIARIYELLAAACLVIVLLPVPLHWLTLWPACALLVVAAGYRGAGVRVFRKQNGKLPWSTRLMLAPFLLASKLSIRWLSRSQPASVEITSSVLVGRRLNHSEAESMVESGVVAVLDVTSEYSEAKPFKQVAYLNLPVLDHTAPTTEQLSRGAFFIREHARHGRVYVHCALGYSRSVAMVAAWLLTEGLAVNVNDAVEHIRRRRPCALVTRRLFQALQDFHASASEHDNGIITP
jgi:diacylglycerol kinase (ATP)